MNEKTNTELVLDSLEKVVDVSAVEHGKTVSEIVQETGLTQPTVDKYLKILRAGGEVDYFLRSGVKFWYILE